MTPETYAALDATEIARRVRARETTAREIAEAALARFDAVEPRINAFATLDREGALATAQAIDARLAAGGDVGPLAGVPVAIKDLVLTKGLRTTFGSRLYADYVPEVDDICVERLRAADAVILGKSNCSEFGFGAHGCNLVFAATRNPWDLTRTPGGSSAGTAAALAAGVVPIAIGSDGGGSIRIPAAFCGLVGVKASMGRVPLWPGCRDVSLPGASGWESIEHIGPLARTVADAALMLSVIAGPDPRDRLSIPAESGWLAAPGGPLPRGLRVEYWPDWNGQPVEPGVAAAVEAAVRALAEAFAFDLRIAAPPAIDLGAAFGAIIALETDLTGLRALVDRAGVEVTPAVAGLLGQRLPLEAATDAVTTRKAFAHEMARRMAGIDLLLTPTVPIPPFAHDAGGPGRINGIEVGEDGWSPFTSPFNLTGQPAASLPCGMAEGLPVGLQIVGPHLGDGMVLRAAAAFESVLRPTLASFPSF